MTTCFRGGDSHLRLLSGVELEEQGRRELARLSRYGHPVSLAIVGGFLPDARHAVAHAVAASLRPTDAVGRDGEQALLVLLPNTGSVTARLMADEIVTARALPAETGAAVGIAQAYIDEDWLIWRQRAESALVVARTRAARAVVVDEAATAGGDPDSIATGFIQLVWRAAYASGNALMDAQHRELFRLANEALCLVTGGANGAEVTRLLWAVKNACEEHFADEEALLANVHYPEIGRHARLHADLLRRIEALLDKCMQGELDPRDVTVFVAHDVIAGHMLREDRRHFGYLRPARRDVP
jgi:hemerythrin-like metal-binding protein